MGYEMPFDREVIGDYLERGAIIYYLTRQDSDVLINDLLDLGLDQELVSNGFRVYSPDNYFQMVKSLKAANGKKVYMMTDSMKEMLTAPRGSCEVGGGGMG